MSAALTNMPMLETDKIAPTAFELPFYLAQSLY
jgi:hypothetical protein